MDLGALWQWINDNGSGLSAIAAISTGVVAIIALRSAAMDSRERTRPYVVAEFRRAENSHSAIDLVIRNTGQSVARDVRVAFSPSFEVPDVGGPYMTSYLLQRYATPIPTLGPGQELSNIWFSGRSVPGSNEMANHEPTPDLVTVTVTYRSTHSTHQDVFPLHVDLIRLTTFSTSSTSLVGRLKTIDQSLDGARKALQQIARNTEPVD